MPPAVVVSSVLTDRFPTALSEPDVLLIFSVLYVPPGIFCPPEVAVKVTTPVVPDQVRLAGIAGSSTLAVVIVPLLVTEKAPVS